MMTLSMGLALAFFFALLSISCAYQTKCLDPPKIVGGYVAYKMRRTLRSDTGGTVTTIRAIYKCDDGTAPIGKSVYSTCRVGLGERKDGTWSEPPRCSQPIKSPSDFLKSGFNVVSMKDMQPPADQESPCATLQEVDDENGCEYWEQTNQWRYRKSSKTCEKVAYACPGSPWQNSFASLAKCQTTCKLSADQSAIVKPAPVPVPVEEQPNKQPAAVPTTMTGGLRGPQCITGAGSKHTSCLPDSGNLVSTERYDYSEVLQQHNNVRQKYASEAKSMPMLQWDESLAVTAERWAAQCPNWHDSPNARKNPKWDYSGQNICYSSGYKMSWTDCVKAWADEAKDWQYGVGQTSSSAVVGHFTQLVWADTLFVGCGRAKCNGEWEHVLVCNYGPGGNIAMYGSDPYAKPYERNY